MIIATQSLPPRRSASQRPQNDTPPAPRHPRAPASAAFTRSGRKGTMRSRTPVASNTALLSAAGTGAEGYTVGVVVLSFES